MSHRDLLHGAHTSMLNTYYNQSGIEEAVKAGAHRDLIGGLWDEIGQLQLDFLISNGLRPHHRLVDIGCGSLRAGVRLIRYLDAGNYFGTDLNESLLVAGYEIELAREGLQRKQPRTQLITDGEFDFSWCQTPFDLALAHSVFTHLPLNFLRVCLERLAGAVVQGGRFYATIFEIPADEPTYRPRRHEPGGVTTFGQKDPYHHRYADAEHCCRGLPWTPSYIGEWGHPRAQRMIRFTRD